MAIRNCIHCGNEFRTYCDKKACSTACHWAAVRKMSTEKKSLPLTVERIREVLDYDPETGVFRWRSRITPNCHNVVVGAPAGTLDKNGYVVLQILRKKYFAHHMAWAIHYGEFANYVEHKNRDRRDNRIENLRLSTHQQNTFNRGIYANNTSGFKGVRYDNRKWHKKRWYAIIYVSGRPISLGYYDTAEEAAHAYNQAALKYFGEFACLNDLASAVTSTC
jgi:hypothetical protein